MRPAKLTYLRAGKAIGSQEHIGFCDTFNWLVDFCKNLRGDGLYITVDNKFGDIPTVTFTPTTDFGTGGGSNYTPYPAPFDLKQVTTTTTDPDTNEETTTTQWMIVNNVFFTGREPRWLVDTAISEIYSGTYWLKITTNSSGGGIQTWGIERGPYIQPTATPQLPSPGNTDIYTWYPLWSVEVSNGTVTPTFDWRPSWKLPFYST